MAFIGTIWPSGWGNSITQIRLVVAVYVISLLYSMTVHGLSEQPIPSLLSTKTFGDRHISPMFTPFIPLSITDWVSFRYNVYPESTPEPANYPGLKNSCKTALVRGCFEKYGKSWVHRLWTMIVPYV